MKIFTRRLSTPKKWVLGAFFFSYAALLSLLIQFVVIPRFLPHLHVGNGLLADLDSPGFHQLGIKISDEIRQNGWSTWSLLGGRTPLHNLVGAWYALFYPAPWTLIPLTAGAHALAAILLISVTEFFFGVGWVSVLAVFPFFFFPSTFAWVAQMNKDAPFMAGSLLFLYGWLLWSQTETWKKGQVWVQALVFILLGGFLVWMSRGYQLQLFQFFSIVLAILNLFRFRKNKPLLAAVCFFLICLLPSLFPYPTEIAMGVPDQFATTGDRTVDPLKEIPKMSSEVPDAPPFWNKSGWLPDSVEHKLHSFSKIRRGFLFQNGTGGTSVDTDTDFKSAGEMVVYLPRAMQIAFLSPFPNQWVQTGSRPTSGMFRKITGLEMCLAYLILPFFLVAVWVFRYRFECWALVGFCLVPLLVQAYVLANIGTLYRLRYFFFMSLITLGFGYALSRYRKAKA